MIVKKHIEKDLKRLNTLYSESLTGNDPNVPIFFSKLGILELSGWLEESFDSLARRSVKNLISEQKFHNLVDDAVGKNHGFHFDNNFLLMLSKISGLPLCEQFHSFLDNDGSLSVLKADIEMLLIQRRKAAHVSLAATTIPFDSPSVTIARLNRIYPILRRSYSWFCGVT